MRSAWRSFRGVNVKEGGRERRNRLKRRLREKRRDRERNGNGMRGLYVTGGT
jgi:hypothetical protein